MFTASMQAIKDFENRPKQIKLRMAQGFHMLLHVTNSPFLQSKDTIVTRGIIRALTEWI